MSEANKQLKIKTGSVKRLAKEVLMYKKDEQTETDRVARMKATGSDASDIKHAVSLSRLEPIHRLHCIPSLPVVSRNKCWQRQL